MPSDRDDPEVRAARLENELGRAKAALAAIESSRSFRLTRGVLVAVRRLGVGRRGQAVDTTHAPAPRPTRVLLVALGLDAPALEAVVATVARATKEGFRALFIVDADDFTPVTRAGFQYEYVPPVADVRHRFPGLDYPVFVQEHIDEVSTWFRPTAAVVVDHASASLEAILRGLLADASLDGDAPTDVGERPERQ